MIIMRAATSAIGKAHTQSIILLSHKITKPKRFLLAICDLRLASFVLAQTNFESAHFRTRLSCRRSDGQALFMALFHCLLPLTELQTYK